MKWIILITIAASFAFAQDNNFEAATGLSQGSISDYESNYKLRQDRKVGAGLGVGGALGGVGGLFELNVEDENATLVGFGTGTGYQTLVLAWKKSFEGEYFTPYTTLGYAHWWDSGSKSQADRSSTLNNFLSDNEKATNNFGLDLVTGSFGMQYNQLSGEFAGSSFYLELGALLSLENTKLLPTGSVGALYYF